ncbi:MAG: hypothetical protein MJ180_01765 [Candidatus Gastranaerophilales bacterium]|nr:hypothetical protein [Candidatus Gastranaerophilales bacterium]
MTEENNMDKELLFKQYKLYCEQKESFANRNFTTNKFYLCVIIAIYLIMFFSRDLSFPYSISANLIMAIIGIAVSFFWWSNTDAYNIMIKVKLKHVIDEMEKQLPFQMHKLEMDKFKEYKKEHKVIIFSDMQKGVAIAMMLLFFALFLIELIQPIVAVIYGPIETYSKVSGI